LAALPEANAADGGAASAAGADRLNDEARGGRNSGWKKASSADRSANHRSHSPTSIVLVSMMITDVAPWRADQRHFLPSTDRL